MAFPQFLVLLLISGAVSSVLHYGLSYYTVPGTKSFFGKIVLGYAGALWAGALIGNWEFIPGLTIASVPVIPAIFGSLAMIVFAVDATESLLGRSTNSGRTTSQKQTSSDVHLAGQL